MKHILGYGLLSLALVGGLVSGCKHDNKPVFLKGGNNKKGEFTFALADKSAGKTKGQDEVTDHPGDYLNPLDPKEKVTKFTWTYTEAFEIRFGSDATKVPCKEAQEIHFPGIKNEIVADPVSTPNPDGTTTTTYTATCTLKEDLPTPPNPLSLKEPGAQNGTHFYYWVYLTNRQFVGPKGPPGGLQTCDGCFLEID